VASLSPELFLRRRGDVVTSSPIKGTLPLSASPSALRASTKDVAENIMIVDLVRNDLGRVAVTGSVTVPELLVVRPAPGVWHLVSTVSAQVPVDLPTSALLDATFPPYRSLLPSEWSSSAEIPVAPLVEAVKRVALVTDRNAPVPAGDERSRPAETPRRRVRPRSIGAGLDDLDLADPPASPLSRVEPSTIRLSGSEPETERIRQRPPDES